MLVTAIVVGVITTVLTLVLIVACAPNSTPRQGSQLRLAAHVVATIGIAAPIVAIIVHRSGQPAMAPWFAGAPIAVGALTFAFLARQRP